ncbi:MAG TPA: hypothetical protein VKB57_03290 [Acidimicrobiales bacterium]|nr:hypothetical protein [Acidimicrobiales bacterium]
MRTDDSADLDGQAGQDASPDTAAGPPEGTAAGGRRELTIGEAGGLAVAVAVAAIATSSVALAQLGHHDGWLAVGLGVAATALVAGVALVLDGRPRLRVDLAELGILAAVALAAGFFFLPGFHYEWDDKDPGVYVAHAFAIARTGDVWIDDDVIARGIKPEMDLGGRLPGIWLDGRHPGQVTGQFFPQYSALLATADDIAGSRALFNVNPLLAMVALGLIVLATRRAAGTLVAGVSAALLVTSMMQVWQAKYPSTEILAEFLLAGLLLAAVLAISRRSTAAGLVVGLLAGVSFLARPDGFLYVLLVAAGVAAALAADRFDRRSVAVLAGLAVTLPYAFWNAYVARLDYTRANDVPGGRALAALILAVLAAGAVARYPIRAVARRWPRLDLRRPDDLPPKLRLGIGIGVTVASIVTLLLFYYREQIFGRPYGYLVFTGDVERTYNELNLRWMALFVTVWGLFVMGAGIAVLMLRRWRAPLFALVLPGALLLPVYLYDAKVSMRLIWWVRRFVPAVMPAVFILMALAICWALTRKPLAVKLVGALVGLALVVDYASMSLPLRHHREMGGSEHLAAAVADFAGDQRAVFLFTPSRNIYGINRNAPGIVWFVHDQVAARVPAKPTLADIEQYRRAFPGQKVFLVNEGTDLPAGLPRDRFSKAGEVVGTLEFLEERKDVRPKENVRLTLGTTVWRVE